MTDQDDTPLLHLPNLMNALLRIGCRPGACLEDAVAALRQERAVAHEAEVQIDEETLTRALEHLRVAGLVEPDALRTTRRGRLALRDHPLGIDDSVLMEFSEFRSWVESLSAGAPPENPHALEFQRGWLAAQEGREDTDNPFAVDTAQHAAWSDGWQTGRKSSF